jgi:hypothetical protein
MGFMPPPFHSASARLPMGSGGNQSFSNSCERAYSLGALRTRRLDIHWVCSSTIVSSGARARVLLTILPWFCSGWLTLFSLVQFRYVNNYQSNIVSMLTCSQDIYGNFLAISRFYESLQITIERGEAHGLDIPLPGEVDRPYPNRPPGFLGVNCAACPERGVNMPLVVDVASYLR